MASEKHRCSTGPSWLADAETQATSHAEGIHEADGVDQARAGASPKAAPVELLARGAGQMEVLALGWGACRLLLAQQQGEVGLAWQLCPTIRVAMGSREDAEEQGLQRQHAA